MAPRSKGISPGKYNKTMHKNPAMPTSDGTMKSWKIFSSRSSTTVAAAMSKLRMFEPRQRKENCCQGASLWLDAPGWVSEVGNEPYPSLPYASLVTSFIFYLGAM